MDFRLICTFIRVLPPVPDQQARYRQYAEILQALSPPLELADKTAQLLAEHLDL